MEIEKILDEKDLIVSSTNSKGIISYVNNTFSEVSGYKKSELYGQPHNIIRHPHMPKTIFKYIWTTLLSKKLVVAYVKNYVKGNNQYYWVKAVMYPKVIDNKIVSITSYRTKATTFEIEQIKEVYKMLLAYEREHSVDESLAYFMEYLQEKNLTYEKMMNRLNDHQQILNRALLNIDIPKFKTDHLILRGRIESLVEKGYKNIDVPCDTSCAIGKCLTSLENESFAKDKKFIKIKNLHSQIHRELQEYANAEDSNRKSFIESVYSDIEELFKLLEDLKNNHDHKNIAESM